MNAYALIPTPDTIPAPPLFFGILDVLLFLLHIVAINVVVGGSLLSLFSPINGNRGGGEPKLTAPLAGKLPVILPFAITLGVAPLLFVQVLYGTFFYTSSVLMASYWIAVIPLLIVAYYGIYLYSRTAVSPSFARQSLIVAVVFFLFIGFTYVNNLSLMMDPERWAAYFRNRSGTILNLSDPTLIPRYLHFLCASLAVAALSASLLWERASRREGHDYANAVKKGLNIFAAATFVQLVVGAWFFLSLPGAVMERFLGHDIVRTVMLWGGVILGIGAIMAAIRGLPRPTAVLAAVTLVAMVVTRDGVRTLYLKPYFSVDRLQILPQYGTLALFILVLLAGLGAVFYMLRIAFAGKKQGGEA